MRIRAPLDQFLFRARRHADALIGRLRSSRRRATLTDEAIAQATASVNDLAVRVADEGPLPAIRRTIARLHPLITDALAADAVSEEVFVRSLTILCECGGTDLAVLARIARSITAMWARLSSIPHVVRSLIREAFVYRLADEPDHAFKRFSRATHLVEWFMEPDAQETLLLRHHILHLTHRICLDNGHASQQHVDEMVAIAATLDLPHVRRDTWLESAGHYVVARRLQRAEECLAAVGTWPLRLEPAVFEHFPRFHRAGVARVHLQLALARGLPRDRRFLLDLYRQQATDYENFRFASVARIWDGRPVTSQTIFIPLFGDYGRQLG